MVNFEQFRQSFKTWSDKINTTVESVVDQTAISLRITARRHDLEKEYATLGKLTYQRLTPDALPEVQEPVLAENSQTGDIDRRSGSEVLSGRAH